MEYPCTYYCRLHLPQKPKNRGRRASSSRARKEFVPVDPEPITKWLNSLSIDLKKQFVGFYISRDNLPSDQRQDWIEEQGGERKWSDWINIGVSFTSISRTDDVWELEGTWPPR